MYLPYIASTEDDETSAEVKIRIIINSIWTDKRRSNKNDKKKSHNLHNLITFAK
jgi:hypothetical protein